MKDMYILASNHSLKRVKERMGVNKSNAHNIICNARERGLSPMDFSGREYSYLASKESNYSWVVAYQGYFFVFSNSGVCITVAKLPDWFGKKGNYDGKEKIRELKKYWRHHSVEKISNTYYELDNLCA